MKTGILLFSLYYILFTKITEAQWARRTARTPPPAFATTAPRPAVLPAPWPTSLTTSAPPVPATSKPASQTTLTSSPTASKTPPETATVYILPAPPSSPKITVLDPSVTTLESYLESYYKEFSSKEPSKFKETSQNFASNLIANRPSFKPPPAAAPIALLPDLKDETPYLIQNKFGQLPKSEPKVCNACAELIEKLPIFKFDEELLSGFLTGLGI